MTRTVIAVVDDLFFASKIRGMAEQLGITVQFAKTIDATIGAAKRENATLVIADLQSRTCDPNELARSLKSHPDLRSITLVGFFSHVNVDLQRQALEAGFDHTLPNSMLTKSLPQILKP